MPKTKAKQDLVTPAFTQEEAKMLAGILTNYRSVALSVGNGLEGARCEMLKQKVVDASGTAPDTNPITNVDLDD